MNGLLQEDSSSSHSVESGRSQLVDLMIEDTEAEDTERVRARKEGGAVWNEDEAKHFMYEYADVIAKSSFANLPVAVPMMMRTKERL